MADARPCSSGDRAPDSGSGCRPFESGQGRFGAVAQWQGVPSATGRSRVRTPPAPRHAACRRMQAQTFRGTTSRQDGAPPRWDTQTAASRRSRARRRGRPARPRAGPCGCGAAAARLLPKQETAGSNPVIRSIRKTKTMDLIRQWDSQPSFPCGRFRKNMDEQPRHGHAASRNKETCHRPGSSEEEQVPFKHWVRIS